jgi:PAS domain S-box-containing protein
MGTETLQFLIVEDDEDDFLHVCHLLKKSVGEADVERAATAEAAVAMANDHPHDLCIVDYRLGDRDGLEVLRNLKNREEAAPVIFLTGQGDEQVAVQAMKAGATDYLLKSKLNAQSLETAVRHALRLGREQEALRVARRALGASEHRFRALVENSSDVIALLDALGTIVYVSRSVQRMMGFAPEEMVETCAFDHIHPEDVEPVRQVFAVLLKSPGVPMRAEYRRRHKDGTWRFMEATAINRLDDPAVGAIVVNERDTTERRQAEAEFRKLSSAVEQSADLVVMTDPNGVIEYVNPAFEALTGYTREETVGKTPRILKSGRQDEAFYQRMWGTLLAGEIFRGALVNLKKNGEPYWEEKTITPVLDEHGKVRHFISNDRDITERRTAEEALRSSEERYRLLFERNLAGVYRASAGEVHGGQRLAGPHAGVRIGEGVVDEARCKNRFAEIRLVEAQLQHDRVDNRDRSRGKRHSRQPTGAGTPVQDVVCDGSTAEERSEKADQAHGRCLFPLGAENNRIEFRPGQKGENDGAGAGEKADPSGAARQPRLSNE